LDLRLYVIVDPSFALGRSAEEVAAAAVAGGATMLQVRAKEATTGELLALTQSVLAIGRPAQVPVVVNDRVDVALAAGADGAHVGESDLPADVARRLLGADAILGCSAASAAAARLGARLGANYLGVGDVFGTSSKPDAGPPLGLDGLAEVAGAAELPVVAIGGIDPTNAAAAIRAGAHGVAVISAVVSAADVRVAAARLRAVVDEALAAR
jgi:thiamine-phosphate pyrophosphorylase